MAGYIPRWFTRPQTVSHPSTNPAVRGLESNSQPVDHESDALTTTLASHSVIAAVEEDDGDDDDNDDDHDEGISQGIV